MSKGKNKGYVSVYREITSNWIWEDKPFARGQAWIDLIMLAKYEDGKVPSKTGFKNGKRGTVYGSVKWLSERWGWSWDKTMMFLKMLKEDDMIDYPEHPDNNRGVSGINREGITIVNYDKFQTPTGRNREQIVKESGANRERIVTSNKENKGKIKENNPPLYSPQRGDVPTGKLEDMDPEEKRKWRDAGWRIDNDGEWVNIGE